MLALLNPTEGKHYSFTNEAPILFSASMAHIAVPVPITPLQKSIPLIYRLVNHVREMANKHENITQLQALSNIVTEEFDSISFKVEDVQRFFLKYEEPTYSRPMRSQPVSEKATTTTTEATTKVKKVYFDANHTFYKSIFENILKNERIEQPPLPLVADLPVWKTISIESKKRKRKRRFVGGVIAGILAAIGTSTLFGLFSGSKLDSLGESVNSAIRRQQEMILLIDKESEDIRTNRISILSLVDAVSGIEKLMQHNQWINNVQTVTLVVRHQIQKVQCALDLYIAAIQQAANHRLAYGLLTFEAAEAALANITQVAKQRKMTPILQTAQQIHQLEASFLTNDEGVTLILHVPLASEDTVFHLWRFTSFPLRIGQKVFGHIHSEKSLIALGSSDINHKPSYVELGDVELSLCSRFFSLYICPHSRVISRPTRPSCLHALYHGEHESAVKLCSLHLSTDRDDTVIPLSKNEFVSFTSRPGVYTMNCYHNGSVKSGLQLFGVQTIRVDEGCQAILPNFKIQAAADIYYTAPPKAFTWTIPAVKWLEDDMSIDDLSSAVEILESMKGLPKIDPHQVNIIRKMHVPYYRNTGIQISWIFAGTAFLFGGFLILGVCAKTWCCRISTTTPKFDGANFQKNNDSMDKGESNLLPKERE